MCGACSGTPPAGAVRLAEGDAAAVADLTAQARGRRDAVAKLTRAVRDRIRDESAAVDVFDRGLADLFKSISEELFADLDALTPSERDALRQLTDTDIGALVDAAGLDDVRTAWADSQARVAAGVVDAAGLGGVERPRVPRGATALDALVSAEQGNLWGDRVRQPAISTIRRGFQAAADGRPARDIIPQVQRDLGVTRGRAKTEARTQVATFSRTVTSVVAEASGVDWFIYRGPDDGLTRPFCQELVGKAFQRDQIDAMNNAQTMVSPMFSGGGYNCRHAWLPVTEGFVERHAIDRGTMANVRAANSRAQAAR